MNIRKSQEKMDSHPENLCQKITPAFKAPMATHYEPTSRNVFSLAKSRPDSKKKQCGYSILAAAGLGTKLNPPEDSSADQKKIKEHLSEAENAFREGKEEEGEAALWEVVRGERGAGEEVQTAHDTLARLALARGDTPAAEQLLVRLLERLSGAGLPGDHHAVVLYSLKLARLYFHTGDHQLAEMGFRNCITLQKGKYMKGDREQNTLELWVGSLYWYGSFLLGQERFSEAKSCFLTAYKICQENDFVHPSQVMVLLYNLGEAAFGAGEYNESLRHLLNAVVVGRGSGSNELASYYTKIGLVYLAKGLAEEAANWCSKAPGPQAQECLRKARAALAP